MKASVRLILWLTVMGVGTGFAMQAPAETEIWQAIPGTSTPDHRGPLYIERNGVVYPAIPGTRTPDFDSDDRRIIRGGTIYRAIPGTNTPDYGSGRYLIR
ncbi:MULTISPECIES: hypothetical protein [unclassified Thiocapsa]|uniref:hypothetical protein n=1 Tax=unclassified Thiocapsa TaxID=2641286 RepID=UPI0035AEC4DC